ncbi:methyl-accepting chemotaxis protein [Pseudomarimonas salicorniae]|uniref:Methyl-accepting chemotaxis protein n=1 Tax=Pseudomarimonas salicorniae TaxID=2933270 RepID=A0ABT0GKG0_9GAMM|nr:methyl-accepting chemotaxis protein [Lysobacter sp. CAU 1642]MCK7595021.1 methyl-accepting chemotaxis protein [Lysobacter sp. CAU 1642]
MLGWLDDWSLQAKFLLLAGLVLAAVALPAWQDVSLQWAAMEVSEAELRGAPLASTVTEAVFSAQRARGLAALRASGGAADAAQLDEATKRVDRALAELARTASEEAGYPATAQALAEARRAWDTAQQAFAGGDPRQVLTDGTTAVSRLLRALDAVRDESGYSYTPYADAFHLMLASLKLGPELGEGLGRLRGNLGSYLAGYAAAVEAAAMAAPPEDGSADGTADGPVAEAASPPTPDAQQRGRLQVLLVAARERAAQYFPELDKALARNPALAEVLGAESAALRDSLEQALSTVEADISSDQPSMSGAESFALLTAQIDRLGAFNTRQIQELSGLSAANAEATRDALYLLGAELFLLIGLLVLIAGGMLTSILHSVRRAGGAAQDIAALRLDRTIEARGSDELAGLLRALDRMRCDLRERIEREAVVAAENARVRRALDAGSAGMMIADAEGAILYMNPSIERVLREAEPVLRERTPGFSVDALAGQRLALFADAPELQKAVSSALPNAHQAEVRLGARVMELHATPIKGEEGTRLGTALEWLDRSAESTFREGLRAAVARARAGRLDARVDTRIEDPRFRELAEVFNELIGTTASAIGEVETVMQALAEGNLSVRSKARLEGKFGELNQNANATADALGEVIGEIQRTVEEIHAASGEIAEGNNDLSKRTEQAAASIEETAAALHEVNSMVASSADHASEAKELAGQAAQTAAEGGQAVIEVVSTMQAIRESSKKMSDIISVIDGIAFQTNILALNAAVEAARAGEQGRGFAVVASEVRALAQRSADAAKEIAGLIRQSEARVEEGAGQVQRAGDRMDSIVASARQVAEIVAEIAAGAAEQAKGINEVNAAVEQMDQATQANSALVEEIAAAAQALSQQASSLNEIAGRFVR